jgi:hypothetical protein
MFLNDLKITNINSYLMNDDSLAFTVLHEERVKRGGTWIFMGIHMGQVG